MQTGWIGTGTDEAVEAQEALTRALLAPETLAEIRAAKAARDAEATRAADLQDGADTRAWLGGGLEPGQVPDRFDPVELENRKRLTRARELLAAEGLHDLLGGGGGIFDPNVGYIPAAGPRVTQDEAMERAVTARDRRERERRESVGLDAIARSREARPGTWGETMARFLAGA